MQCERVWSFSICVLVSRQNQPATAWQSQSFCCEHVCRVFFKVSAGKDLLLTGLQRRSDADKSWRRDSVCSRCQPSKIEMRSGVRQWRVIAENNSKEGNRHRSKKKIDEGWKRASRIRRFWTFDVRVSWQLLFDSLSVNLLSEAWDTQRRPRLAEPELVLHSLRQEVPTQNGVMVKLRKGGFSPRSTSQPHFLKPISLS